jgi:Domain of unknown function (DUF4249)
MKVSLKIVFIGSFFYSCVTLFEPQTNFRFGQLIVNGRITNLEEQEPIILQKTRSDGLRVSIRGAEVTIFEDEAPHRLEEGAEGKYFMPTALKGKPGRFYKLKIVLSNGDTFTSLADKMPTTNGDFTPSFEILRKEFIDDEGTVVTRPYLKIISDVSLDSAGLNIRWDVTETYFFTMIRVPSSFGANEAPQCFNTNTISAQDFSLFDGTDIRTKTIKKLKIAEREIDKTFAERHGFTVYQNSISSEAFAYWKRVRFLITQVGSIFDTPPALIAGNISNDITGAPALGFFEASNIRFKHFFVYPSDIPFYIPRPCNYIEGKADWAYPKECFDCTYLPNGTYVVPKWFLN